MPHFMNEFKCGGGGVSCSAIRMIFYISRNRSVSGISKQLVIMLHIYLSYVGVRKEVGKKFKML